VKPLTWYKALGSRKGRREGKAFIAEGARAIGQIAQSSSESLLEILAEKGIANARSFGVPVRYLSAGQMKAVASSKTPQGMLGVVSLPDETYCDSLPHEIGRRIVVLEDIQDPGNIGACIRSAAALGYDGVLMSRKCADPFSPKSVAASAGSVLSVWLRRSESYRVMARALKSRGYKLLAADAHGAPVADASAGALFMLALGNEGSGLSEALRDMADATVGVPIVRSRSESLNVAAAGAICMYALTGRDRI
jgi:TrmH family RNA methyltransferase